MGDAVLQYVFTGLTLGSVYALQGLGLAFVYKASGVINLAQGEFFTLGAFMLFTLLTRFHLAPPLALLGALAVVALVALASYYLAIRPLNRNGTLLSRIIMTVAIMFMIEGGTMLVWGKEGMVTPYFLPGPPLKIGGAILPTQALIVMAVLLMAVVGTQLALKRTKWGKALRACAENPFSARLMGIDVQQMTGFAYLLTGAVGAISGGVAAPLLLVHHNLGTPMLVKGFLAAVIGGLDNPQGAIIGGLLVGLFETLAAGLISSDLKEIFSLSLLLIILITRPQGILGKVAS